MHGSIGDLKHANCLNGLPAGIHAAQRVFWGMISNGTYVSRPVIADGSTVGNVVHQMHGCLLASAQPSVEGFMRGRGQDGVAEGLNLSASALGDALQDAPVSDADAQQEDLVRAAGTRRRWWAKVLLDAYQVLEDLLLNPKGVSLSWKSQNPLRYTIPW